MRSVSPEFPRTLYAVRRLDELGGTARNALSGEGIEVLKGEGSLLIAVGIGALGGVILTGVAVGIDYYLSPEKLDIFVKGACTDQLVRAYDALGGDGVSSTDLQDILAGLSSMGYTGTAYAVGADRDAILAGLMQMNENDVFIYSGHGNSSFSLFGSGASGEEIPIADMLKAVQAHAPGVVYVYNCTRANVWESQPHNRLTDLFFGNGTRVFVGTTGLMPVEAAGPVTKAFWLALANDKTFGEAKEAANEALKQWVRDQGQFSLFAPLLRGGEYLTVGIETYFNGDGAYNDTDVLEDVVEPVR